MLSAQPPASSTETLCIWIPGQDVSPLLIKRNPTVVRRCHTGLLGTEMFAAASISLCPCGPGFSEAGVVTCHDRGSETLLWRFAVRGPVCCCGCHRQERLPRSLRACHTCIYAISQTRTTNCGGGADGCAVLTLNEGVEGGGRERERNYRATASRTPPAMT